jgi:hypothetical protein
MTPAVTTPYLFKTGDNWSVADIEPALFMMATASSRA